GVPVPDGYHDDGGTPTATADAGGARRKLQKQRRISGPGDCGIRGRDYRPTALAAGTRPFRQQSRSGETGLSACTRSGTLGRQAEPAGGRKTDAAAARIDQGTAASRGTTTPTLAIEAFDTDGGRARFRGHGRGRIDDHLLIERCAENDRARHQVAVPAACSFEICSCQSKQSGTREGTGR